MDEVSKLSTYEQVPKFASGRDIFHSTVQASAVSIPRASMAVDKTHLLADMCLPLPVARRAQQLSPQEDHALAAGHASIRLAVVATAGSLRYQQFPCAVIPHWQPAFRVRFVLVSGKVCD